MVEIIVLNKNATEEQLDEAINVLRQRQAELNSNYKRRHGKQEKQATTKWEEYKRLYNNVKSQESRLRKANLEKQSDKSFNQLHNNEEEDEYGIRPVDERRYKKCFHSGYIGAPVYRKYIRTMTGLSLKQIAVLQERTGLIPVPAVGKAEAEEDERRRIETGDIY